VLIGLTDMENAIITKVCEKEAKRGKSKTKEKLFKEVFFAQALTGFGDHIHPNSLINKHDLIKIKND